jgi:hypothetical protein
MFGPQLLNYSANAVAIVPLEQYLVVQGSGTTNNIPNAGVATAVTQNLLGISQNIALAGEMITVCPLGLSRARAAAAIAAFAEVTTQGSGRIITAASGDGGIIGYTLEAAAADGDIVQMWVQRMRKTP